MDMDDRRDTRGDRLMGTVVVVEDDPTILELVIEVLEDERFHVIPSRGENADALHKIEQHHPEIAVLDYHVPGMSGVEIAQRARG